MSSNDDYICPVLGETGEDEVPDLKLIRKEKRKEVLETESECGEVKIKYAYYETNIYEYEGKEIRGKECYKGTGRTDWAGFCQKRIANIHQYHQSTE